AAGRTATSAGPAPLELRKVGIFPVDARRGSAYVLRVRQEDSMEYSLSPDGEKFPLPGREEYAREYARLEALVAEQRALGRESVVVMGVGFVGVVMAAVVADSVGRKTGKPGKFVIGMQRPSPRSYWKIPLLNRGVAPVKAEDPEVEPMIARCVKEKKTLAA